MLRTPLKYEDTVSFHSINAPFENLFYNNNFLLNLSIEISENINTNFDALDKKNINSNGVSGYFKVRKINNAIICEIFNFEHVEFVFDNINKLQNAETTEYTPLSFQEIKQWLEDNKYIKYKHFFSIVLDKASIPNTNLLTKEEASKIGFEKGSDVVIDELDVKNTTINTSVNGLINIEELSTFFINKNKSYVLSISKDEIKALYLQELTFDDLMLEEYQNDFNKEKLVSTVLSLKDYLPLKTESVKLKIKNPSLNSPINKASLVKKGNEFISLTEKNATSITINRESEITDNSVLTIKEVETIVKNRILKINSLDLSNFDDFEKLYKTLCDLNAYLKNDLMIESEYGYSESFYGSTKSVVNHYAFKKLITTNVTNQELDAALLAKNYFHKILSPAEKEEFLQIANVAGIIIDFKKDSFGRVFEKICKLVNLIEYPTIDFLQNIINIKKSQPVSINQFILLSPSLFAPTKINAKYYLTIPTYVRLKEIFLLNSPNFYYTFKTNYQYNLIIPVYMDLESQLTLFSPMFMVSNREKREYMMSFPVYAGKCIQNIEPIVNLFEDIAVKLKGLKNDIEQYSVFSSNRAVNNKEFLFIYQKILGSLTKRYYVCNDCMISKDLASVIITLSLLKGIKDRPIYVDISQIIEAVEIKNLSNDMIATITEHNPCSATSSSNILDEIKKIHNVLLSETIIKFSNCGNSEILNSMSISISDEFILKNIILDDAISQLQSAIDDYYSDKEYTFMDRNFDASKSIDISSFRKVFTSDGSLVDKGIDMRYAFDLFDNSNIGTRDNVKCDNEFLKNNAFWTFIYVPGNSGDKPVDSKTQQEGLSSDVVGFYYLVPDITDLDITVDINDLPVFYKKEKGYIATLYEETDISFIDLENKAFYTTTGLTASVDNNDDKQEYYIKVNKLKIKVDTKLDNISNKKIDTNVDNFDFSFIYELKFGALAKSLTSKPNSSVGQPSVSIPLTSFFPNPLTMATQQLNLDFDFVDLDISIDSSQFNLGQQGVSKSGAPLDSPGSIASPVCIEAANPGEDFIPGSISLAVDLEGAIVAYTANKIKTGFRFKKTLIYKYGVIDGLYDDSLGELLANAFTKEEVDELKQNHNFYNKIYVNPDTKELPVTVSSSGLGNPIDFKIELEQLKNAIRKADGTKLDLYDANGSPIGVNDLELIIGAENYFDKGVYITNYKIEPFEVKAKAVTKNKHYPVASVLGDGFKIYRTDSSNSGYNNHYYIDASNKQVVLRITPDVLYNTGVKLIFNEQ